jgi:general secretion pathway protein G
MKNRVSRIGKGFTLIELLVVIAIIGMLSAVILGNLNQTRDKGIDAAIKSNLANIQKQAALYYDNQTPNSYSGMCAGDLSIAAMITAASTVGSVTCNPSSSGFVVKAPLKVQNQYSAINGGSASGQDYWCVDANGTAKVVDTNGNSGVNCP